MFISVSKVLKKSDFFPTVGRLLQWNKCFRTKKFTNYFDPCKHCFVSIIYHVLKIQSTSLSVLKILFCSYWGQKNNCSNQISKKNSPFPTQHVYQFWFKTACDPKPNFVEWLWENCNQEIELCTRKICQIKFGLEKDEGKLCCKTLNLH